MIALDEVLKFVSFTHKYQKVLRGMKVYSEDRYENDLEHVGQIALVGLFLCSQYSLGLQTDLVLKYALVHDLVEIYAGDTFTYSKNEDSSQKVSKEFSALQKIKVDFPEFTELPIWIEEYEHRTNDEAVFVYALDKLLPPINNYLDSGRNWKEEGITLEMLLENKSKKIALNADLYEVFEQLVVVLKSNQDNLFG